MKLSEFLSEQGKFKPNPQDIMKMPRGKMQQWAGKAPVQRLTKKQQQVKDQQPVNPRQPQQPQQAQPAQSKQQQAQQQQAQAPLQTQGQQQAQEQAKQLLGGVDVTHENVAKVLPDLIKKALNKDKQWARELINTVATTRGQNIQTKNRGAMVDKADRLAKQAVRAKMTRQEMLAAAAKLQAQAQQATESVNEAAAAPAQQPQQQAPANPPNAKRIALAQIQAALKKLPDSQLITLRSQIQHLVRGGDAALGQPSLRGVPQKDIQDAGAYQRWKTDAKQQARAVGQSIKQDLTTMPTFKKWFGKKGP